MLRFLPVVLSLALTIWTLVDCIQTDDGSVRNLPKIAWMLLILLFPVVGPVAWLVAGRPAGPLLGGGRPGRGTPGPTRRPARGPDDDPDFLKGL
ncbi:PLD nuclease N-terminal domain-containing protein [Phycicoccus jejuensis]|uniref:PLD nuclease N-terminal domain-containing protein n=1 Tax=Phycicoccus jejuensis TaxID=367299 RepID=UPI0004C3C514|nr:PLD nuclease N-terminal domain-containing protein [Phycicoccus jejuensis]